MSISNQSFRIPIADFTVSLDGNPTLSKKMPVRSQHYRQEVSLAVVAGSHVLECYESLSSTRLSRTVQVVHELWLKIDFVYSERTRRHVFHCGRSSEPVPMK
jgi:wyosine [tRNA(Phe)-imidazoG37] synthetase (radical SAM superfamily)